MNAAGKEGAALSKLNDEIEEGRGTHEAGAAGPSHAYLPDLLAAIVHGRIIPLPGHRTSR